jgi:hypothetical protein
MAAAAQAAIRAGTTLPDTKEINEIHIMISKRAKSPEYSTNLSPSEITGLNGHETKIARMLKVSSQLSSFNKFMFVLINILSPVRKMFEEILKKVWLPAAQVANGETVLDMSKASGAEVSLNNLLYQILCEALGHDWSAFIKTIPNEDG